MKFLKIFGLLILFQCVIWIGSHLYFSMNKSEVLVVVDTSFSMKPNFPDVQNWIETHERQDRYKNIMIGTDKAALGALNDLSSKEVIFRTSFGKLSAENLTRLYSHVKADEKILLSDGSLSPDGWDVVSFN